MNSFISKQSRAFGNARGATLCEAALVIALISFSLMASLQFIRVATSNSFTLAADAILGDSPVQIASSRAPDFDWTEHSAASSSSQNNAPETGGTQEAKGGKSGDPAASNTWGGGNEEIAFFGPSSQTGPNSKTGGADLPREKEEGPASPPSPPATSTFY